MIAVPLLSALALVEALAATAIATVAIGRWVHWRRRAQRAERSVAELVRPREAELFFPSNPERRRGQRACHQETPATG